MTHKRTYRESSDILFDYLARKGWTVSASNLKVRYATSSEGWRLWFRPQAIWIGRGSDMGAARSLWVDQREVDGPTLITKVNDWALYDSDHAPEGQFNDTLGGAVPYSEHEHRQAGPHHCPHCPPATFTNMSNTQTCYGCGRLFERNDTRLIDNHPHCRTCHEPYGMTFNGPH